jgi:hypothetical protein
MRDPDPETTWLAGKVTIRQYRDMVRREDRGAIADVIHKRFEERYLDPILAGPKRHGFAVLAVSCLMVEALESFRQGWPHTDRRSEAAFCGFFQAHEDFLDLRPVAHEFYRAVRCAILHQAETTDGWRVRSKGGLLLEQEGAVHWIDASEFAERLKRVLKIYCDLLRTTEWLSQPWRNARNKLRSICKNSGVTDVTGLA